MSVDFRKQIICRVSVLAFLCMTYTTTAQAGPQGGTVVGGSATITQESATKTGITQTTDKAIINWQSYNINANEHVQYYQPSSSSIALNRVVGQDPSKILGRLSANGNVWLINRNGIVFGAGSRIDVSGLVATTHDITNSNFLAGNYDFNIPGNPRASVINEGNITIGNAGVAAFVAPSVRNSGFITARLGKVALGAANGFTLDLYGDGLISLAVSDEVAQTAFDVHGNKLNSFVKNEGKIKADGGHILLTAKAARGVVNDVVNNTGIIEARSVSQRNGVITLGGGRHGVVRSSGKLIASGKKAGEKGGKVFVTGEKVALMENAVIDVSGHSAGGSALIGGDYKGEGATPTSQFTYMGQDASIYADALAYGNGGKVILWANEVTRAYGTINARGGAEGGDGGFIETSGKEYLSTTGISVDASATNGDAGRWLLDPASVVIASSGDVLPSNPFNNGNTVSTISASSISDVLNTGTNVIITTGTPGPGPDPGGVSSFASSIVVVVVPGSFGDGAAINVEAEILKSSGGDATLELHAHDGVYINQRIASVAGELNVKIVSDLDFSGAGTLRLGQSAGPDYLIDTNGGDFTFLGPKLFTNGKGIRTSGGNILVREQPNFGFPGGPPPSPRDNAFVIGSLMTPSGIYNLNAGSGSITIDGVISPFEQNADNVTLYDNAIYAEGGVTIKVNNGSIDPEAKQNGIAEIYYGTTLDVGDRGDLEFCLIGGSCVLHMPTTPSMSPETKALVDQTIRNAEDDLRRIYTVSKSPIALSPLTNIFSSTGVWFGRVFDKVQQRHEKGLEYLSADPQLYNTIRNIQFKVAGVVAGSQVGGVAGPFGVVTGGKIGGKTASIILKIKKVLSVYDGLKKRDFYKGGLGALNLVSSLVLDVFANTGTPISTADALTIAGASLTSYLYGFTVGL